MIAWIPQAVVGLGGLLLGKSKKFIGILASAAMVVIAGLGTTVVVRGCAVSEAEEARDQAILELGACQTISVQRQKALADLSEQNERNAAIAAQLRERAGRAEQLLIDQQEAADERLEDALRRAEESLSADACGNALLPDDVDRMWRDPALQAGDRDQSR